MKYVFHPEALTEYSEAVRHYSGTFKLIDCDRSYYSFAKIKCVGSMSENFAK